MGSPGGPQAPLLAHKCPLTTLRSVLASNIGLEDLSLRNSRARPAAPRAHVSAPKACSAPSSQALFSASQQEAVPGSPQAQARCRGCGLFAGQSQACASATVGVCWRGPGAVNGPDPRVGPLPLAPSRTPARPGESGLCPPAPGWSTREKALGRSQLWGQESFPLFRQGRGPHA